MAGWGNTSRHARGYGRTWDKLRLTILARDKHLCQVCLKAGRITVATEVDHIKPKAKDGNDHPDNLQSICGPCHSIKTTDEATIAQGRRVRPKFDEHGRPIW